MRSLALVLAATLTLASCTTTDAPDEPREERRPNVLIVVTDDQRTDGTLEVMPHTRKWFATNGTRYTNAFATTPLCCPSRASIFSGRYAHNHDVLKNTEPELLDQDTTIQRYLHDAGYRTAFYGKYFNAWEEERTPPNFDDWAISTHGYYGVEFGTPDGVRTVKRYSTDLIADEAMGFLRGSEGDDSKPWLLFVSTSAMHKPFTPEKRYRNAPVPEWSGNPAVRERDTSDKPDVGARQLDPAAGRRQRARQLRTLMSVDDAVARITRFLDANGETADTLAFFLSDNGISWGEHGFAGKRLPYRESVRIPLLVRWPERTDAPPVDRSLVANLDVLPTVFDAVGITAEHTLDGIGLGSEVERDRLLLEQWGNYSAGLPDWASVLTPTTQYVEYYGREDKILFRELYDLETDPWQLENLAGDRAFPRLHRQLKQLRRCEGDPCGPKA
jgi:arylsulfatase A-like enzyme